MAQSMKPGGGGRFDAFVSRLVAEGKSQGSAEAIENVVFFVAVGHYAGWWGVATAWSLYGIVARLVERAKR